MVVIRRLEGLHRTERTLRHELRVAGAEPTERSRITAALEEVRREIAETKSAREAEIARR